METININNIDNNFIILREKKKEITNSINKGVKSTVIKIIKAIKSEQLVNSNNYKKARVSVKEQLMSSLYREATNSKGATTRNLIADANTLKAYNIAFTIVFRNVIGLESLELSNAQIEQASLYFSVSEINRLIECDTSDALIDTFKSISNNYKKVTTHKVWDTSTKKVSGK